MYPLDFEEFLWAMGEEALAKLVAVSYERRAPLPEGLHRKATRLWREYLLVGGMPQAVVAHGRGRDLAAADRAKRAVLKLYRDDIEKHGGTAAKRIKAVFDATPGQLSKHEKKLVYTQVSKGSRARDFMGAFSWLREAMTANLCTLCEDPSIGLALTEDESTVKCYMADTGLLASMAFRTAEQEIPGVYRQVLRGDAAVNEGMLVENYVAQQLTAHGHDLHFYAKASKERAERMEIDFLIVRPFPDAAMKPRVSPVEVKSGRRYSLVSLDKFAVRFAEHVGEELVVHSGQLRAEGRRLFLPLYMAHLL